MLRKGVATPERNHSPKLTMVMSTRTPLQAFQMLRMGHPIDQIAGYYDQLGILEPDFYMMDKIQKLHALAAYRQQAADAKSDLDKYEAQAAAAKHEVEAKAAEEKRQAEILEAAQKLVTKQKVDNGTIEK